MKLYETNKNHQIYSMPTVISKMKMKKQHVLLPVENFDEIVSTKSERKRHGDLLPNSLRAIFVGPSNCGKTNALFALIFNPNGVRFENIYLYSKSINQPKYQFLTDLLNNVKGVRYIPFQAHEQVITPDDAKPDSLMIFDDIACKKQNHVRFFFCMERHKSVDCFYLCQTYTRIPKHLIRDNTNFIALFRQNEMNLKHIYDDHVNTDMSYTTFKKLCLTCWNSEKFGFIVTDKDSDIDNGRYRKGFDCFITI